MSDKVMITESTLDDIADAIREKNGEEFKYHPNEMPAAVRRIQTGGGGSGSVVAVFPVLLSGEHIADIVVDGDTFALYAPEPIEYQEGTGITIDNGVVSLSDAVQTTLAGKVDTSTFTTTIANLVASVASKQDILTAGQGITITGTTISADGTDVEANPSEEPTEELNSIKIGDTVYEIVGGGGGASAVSDLTDVDLNNLSNGQVLKYNSTSQKWENANESGGTTLPFDVVINSTDNGIDLVYDDGT